MTLNYISSLSFHLIFLLGCERTVLLIIRTRINHNPMNTTNNFKYYKGHPCEKYDMESHFMSQNAGSLVQIHTKFHDSSMSFI